MCGITGFAKIASPSITKPTAELTSVISQMTDALTHRGPDDSGVWTAEEHGVALGHRRLSIIDLSAEGHQPMVSRDGRWVLVYNGEIYNHEQLRETLKQSGCQFRGNSDTEVLLESIAHWGVRETLQQLNGMFAFAVWDKQKQSLTLARDRLGIKPLYYGFAQPNSPSSLFLFGSELKALRQHPNFKPQIDRSVLGLYLENGYIPAPCSIYEGIFKLEPGQMLEISQSTPSPRLEHYWSLRQFVENRSDNATHSEDELDALLRDSVRLRLMSDVPLGTFLSGGIDSSLITALAAEESEEQLRTFTIGFEEAAYDESPYAEKVAKHLGVRQDMHIVTAQEALDTIPQLPQIYDEPFGDSSQIPTLLVSHLARQHVTVCLSGDGGDELFGGYNRYQHIDRIRRKAATIPRALRKPLAHGYDFLKRRLMKRGSEPGLAYRLANTQSDREIYSFLHSHWKPPSGLVVGGESTHAFQPDDCWFGLPSFIENMMGFDCGTYLPEDILCKVDRASMSHGLEVRVPLLDHRVVELSWSMSLDQKVVDGQGKAPLRKLLGRRLPNEMFERPKTGFGIPLGEWLRGPLRDWAEELLDADRLKREGWLHPDPIRKKWAEHLSGAISWEYLLWDVLMFQAWLAEHE